MAAFSPKPKPPVGGKSRPGSNTGRGPVGTYGGSFGAGGSGKPFSPKPIPPVHGGGGTPRGGGGSAFNPRPVPAQPSKPGGGFTPRAGGVSIGKGESSAVRPIPGSTGMSGPGRFGGGNTVKPAGNPSKGKAMGSAKPKLTKKPNIKATPPGQAKRLGGASSGGGKRGRSLSPTPATARFSTPNLMGKAAPGSKGKKTRRRGGAAKKG